MGDILSREEIDVLLKGEGHKSAEVAGKVVKPYDFHKPERFSKEHLRIFQILTDDFCHRLRKHLSSHLRLDLEASIVSIRQTVYKDFTTLSVPTYVATFSMEPLEGSAALEMDPAFLIFLIEHLLGGDNAVKPERRELTAIETDTSSSLAQRIMFCFKEAFEKTLKFYPKIESVESDPQFILLSAPNEPVLLISIEIKVKDVVGNCNICLPYLILESLIPHLNLKEWFVYSQKKTILETEGEINRHLSRTKVTLCCKLGDCELSLQDICNLQEGDVVQLEKTKGSALEINMGGLTKFFAQPGLVGKRVAVKVVGVSEE